MIHNDEEAKVAVQMIQALTDTLVTEGLAMTEEQRRDCFGAMVRYQLVMAAWFGRNRGWSFLPVLSADRVWEWERSPVTFDNPFTFHDEQGEVGVACHVYPPLDEAACRAWGAAHELTVSFPDEPSWWAPGFARIVLYQHPRSFH